MKRLFLGAYLFLVFSLLFVQFILGPVINKVAKVHLNDSITEYNRQLARGAFHMMEEDLLRLPGDEWKNRISQLEPQFGYKIALLAISELTLTKEQMEPLRNGKIAVVDDGELLYQRIGGSDMVLRKGPFSVLEPDPGYFNLVIWFAIIIIIGLLTLICIIPYWRQLRRLSNAAMAFGNGEFNTRVDMSELSNLAPLALAFNTMAERIGQLISSHKELTNAVSHELRTPLSRLRFGLEMLETAEDREKRAHYARELQTDVTELEDLVCELLTFARFDREKPELKFNVHHLEPFLHQVMAESIPDDSTIRCHLHCHLDTDSSHVRFEPRYMARAIGNLMQNAAHFAKSEIQVLVERNGEECSIHIDDDGPGIPKAERLKVFEPFTRLDSSRSRTSGGYGLGLAIVARILKWHNGRATVTDAPLQRGARLTVCWPGFTR
ncbi:MAG: HAMP domain-containing protein [Proteobacteria bacterium]|nr:HAMP domain-containing protein [Pseudomonadota bacterium]